VHGGEFAADPDLDVELAGVAAQDFLGGRLLDEHSAQSEVTKLREVQRDQGEVRGARYRDSGAGTEPIEQAPVVEGIHRPPDERQRLGQAGRLGQPLKDDRAEPGQSQFAGQHEAGRPSTGDNDISVHWRSP
jgi:hypothetical protein